VVDPLVENDITRQLIWSPTGFESCKSCRKHRAYKSKQDGLDHLSQVHFSFGPNVKEPDKSSILCNWLRSDEQLRNEIQHKLQIHLLKICLSQLESLCGKGKDIHYGVANSTTADTRHYLPPDLVIRFEAAVTFIMSVAVEINLVKEGITKRQSFGAFPSYSLELEMTSAKARLQPWYETAQAAMLQAEERLQLMGKPGAEKDSVNLTVIGPEYLLAVICENLRNRQLVQDNPADIGELYRTSVSKLVCQLP